MLSQFRYPSNSIGTGWTDPNEVKALDGVFAIWPSDIFPSGTTNELKSDTFNFAIPSAATIKGVIVYLDQLIDYNALGFGPEGFAIFLNSVSNSKVESIYYDDGGGNSYAIGSNSDTWGYGATLTPAIVNSSSFYVSWFMEVTGGTTRSLAIDAVGMEIFYELPDGNVRPFPRNFSGPRLGR